MKLYKSIITKPILFSTEMVKAILEGRKTQTRRIIKNQPDDRGLRTSNVEFEDWHGQQFIPKYQVKDIIWVRETVTVLEPEHCEGMSNRFYYKASHHPTNEEWRLECIEDGYPYKWKPSIYMPKAACRIFLEVTNVRFERLLDISYEDVQKEGIQISRSLVLGEKNSPLSFLPDGCMANVKKPSTVELYFAHWFSLWAKINGRESLDANPWVWVYNFKRVEKPKGF